VIEEALGFHTNVTFLLIELKYDIDRWSFGRKERTSTPRRALELKFEGNVSCIRDGRE
jgi:hypothetical protein